MTVVLKIPNRPKLCPIQNSPMLNPLKYKIALVLLQVVNNTENSVSTKLSINMLLIDLDRNQ
jgi:hypothetical protein